MICCANDGLPFLALPVINIVQLGEPLQTDFPAADGTNVLVYPQGNHAAKAAVLLNDNRHLSGIAPQQLRQCGLQRLRIFSPRAFVDEFGTLK